jgi:hypothetical protein
VRILFVMLHAGFVRNYDAALRELVSRGHEVHLAFETGRTKLDDEALLHEVLATGGITAGPAPVRAEGVRQFLARSDRTALRVEVEEGVSALAADRWDALAATARLLLDYLRYFEPEYSNAPRLRGRAEKRVPRTLRRFVDGLAWTGRPARRLLARALLLIESAIPVPHGIEQFVRERRPDLLLLTPLVEFGSEQVDYVKCARRLGIPSALCVASWDNLTNKGVMRVRPDAALVWNEAQREEAATLHGMPRERVHVTGAQIFDWWFTAQPTRSREEFCRLVGVPPDRPFLLYTGSSSFIAPDEASFGARWVDAIRRSGDPAVAGAGILIRPHPANVRRWRVLDLGEFSGVAIWPPLDRSQAPGEFRADYLDSLYHCAAVVGINTSAQIEAAILGKAVCTVRAPEFAHSQDGMPHFRHLLEAGGGLLYSADTLDEHVVQLAAALRNGEDAALRCRRFVQAFVRPHGLDRLATPAFLAEVERAAALPRRPRPEPLLAAAARPGLMPLAWAVRRLAEDRPLWILALRPFLSAVIGAAGAGVILRARVVASTERLIKRARRARRTAAHELGRMSRRLQHRAVKRGKRVSAAVLRIFPSARR